MTDRFPSCVKCSLKFALSLGCLLVVSDSTWFSISSSITAEVIEMSSFRLPESIDIIGNAIIVNIAASISAYMRDTLYWFPIVQRISCRMAVLVWRCLLDRASAYLCELCRPVSGLPGRRALRSSVTGKLLVPRAKTATRQRRAFSIVGHSTWNGLPLEIRFLPKNHESAFLQVAFKTNSYRRGWAGGASE